MFRPNFWRDCTTSGADLGPVDVLSSLVMSSSVLLCRMNCHLLPVLIWEGVGALDGPRADANNGILVIRSLRKWVTGGFLALKFFVVAQALRRRRRKRVISWGRSSGEMERWLLVLLE